ncbi:bifunctional 5,10-methylenetetrahydrofolate dehydrogenase/5,10-methenyltetrahydrofolate cyclohydrolase [Mycoplasma mycoides subsp. capri]|uniref:bifunctional 5,10-methylenetetrahydrofolate dehydrogenase/5,10-methenyltetrahydrofolate cyclohydrolase n=1 Tax=Mycoplasma mycoides TaxID=2102 RepID=UPI00223F6F26|nr:bifunctional 5,10-methylenetetrahydrofolate dehydrogenase/5,10-methenyltetrahydrofolate cyclohydrolase [Mycoplasma mycoides]QVJ97024.1 bifunctional 5,10-methylenetetrahydrofolate dehydrogenase/5,10-methenyltetrahydrofolate cyclohydrolase [Mycoplasma mycoides subsp. capri]QVK00005.1 bifunctional 5,10-methylenetetrahydrofolate dehydrogenase/5,10-methenyltetrahydrofolate cyclohydrolase [Mycoplasma mycoides subsp. capri]QVK00888.1 bifunctional 5,10-methylenetetrahydrofolate dehydrogenase/5,10-met
MVILDGKLVSKQIKETLKQQIDTYLNKNYKKPKLAVILIGNDPASELYVSNKIKACNLVGIESVLLRFDQNITSEMLSDQINQLNNDNSVDAILLQLPLPKHLNEQEFLQAIVPLKDVDGFHYINQGKMLEGYDTIYPCTPIGIINLLKAYNIDVRSKDITIIGTSNIVGKPLAIMLSNMGATISMCNKNTKSLKKYTKRSDIVISATGKQALIKKDMIKKNAIVIDVGIIKDPITNKIVGDVDFENVKELCSYITPVPGGVGPMTVAMLLENTFELYKLHIKENYEN